MSRTSDLLEKRKKEREQEQATTQAARAVATTGADGDKASAGASRTQRLMAEKGLSTKFDDKTAANAKSKAALEELRTTGKTTFAGKEYTAPVRQEAADTARKATLYDLTIGSAKRGYLNSLYGEALYNKMVGAENDADKYAEELAGDAYNFAPGGVIGKAVSGAAELLGQQFRQWTNPLTLAAGTGAAGMAALAGQAGPQVLVPEEVLTVPAAFAIGIQAGSAKANFEIEAGHAYQEMLDNGVSESTASTIATVVGGGNAALELVQMDELLKSFKVLNRAGASDGVLDIIKKELGRRGLDVAKETAQEVAQEGVTIAGTQIGSKIDTGDWAYDTGEVAGRLGDTALSSALSFGVMNVPGAAHNIYSESRTPLAQQGDTSKNAADFELTEPVSQEYDEKRGEIVNDALRRAAEQMETEGHVSGKNADRILADPEAVNALGEASGVVIDPAMTQSQRRAAVKAAVEGLASRDNGVDGDTARVTPTRQRTSEEGAQVQSGGDVSPSRRSFNVHQLEEAARTFGENGAKALAATYDGAVDANQFYAGFATVYKAGMNGRDLNSVQNEYAAQLTEPQRYAAYTAGQNDAAASLAREQRAAQYASVAGTDSGLVFDDYVADALDADTAERVNSVAKMLGTRVRFVDSVRGGTANAQISGAEVLVEKNNPEPVMFLLGHEWTHRLQELAPTEYRAFREAVSAEVEEQVRYLMEHYRRAGEDISYEEALDEATANFAGDMIKDPHLLDQFIEKHRGNRSMLEKVRDAIRELVAKLTGAERRAAQTVEGKLTAALEAATEQAARLEANKNAAHEGDSRFSIKRTSKMSLAAQLKMFYDGKMASSDAFYFGNTPASLGAAGLDQLPLAFTIADFKKSTQKKHNIPRRVLKNLLHDLETAQFAFADGDRLGILTTDIDGDGKPLLVAIQKNVQMDADKVNAIRSLYGLDHPDAWVRNQIADGKTFILLDEERANTTLYPYGYMASRKDGIRSLEGTVTQDAAKGKEKFSLKRATSSEIASAEKMENEGAAREDIWAELGVIRDAAGNWVSEIDDSQMKYHRSGDARFAQAHPEYAEYQGLMQKMLYGTLTNEEYAHLQKLDEMWGREAGRLSERVDRGNATLENIVEFDELFAVYPELRNVNVRFADLGGTRERASFNQRTNTITLDKSLRSSPESVLLHEIQHAVQHLEKRPTGASLDYWRDRMASGETFRQHDAEIAQARRRMDAAWGEMSEDLKNRVREINRESIHAKETGDYDRLTELQNAMFDSEDGDLYAEYDNALWEIRLLSENNTPLSAEDLYYRTAGEIEASLVQKRRRMTAAERRANMPDFGWDRAVFSRNGPTSYSLKGSEMSREAAALQEENDLLRERVEYWKGQTRRTKRVTTDKRAVTKAAREIIRSYGADLDAAEIAGELQSLYDYIASGYDGNDELTYTEARRRAEDIASRLVENAVAADDDLYQQYADLRKYLRTTKLTLSEADSHDIADYGDFRKRNMGRLNLTKGETNIDQVYLEMAELWPEFFDEQRETHPVDQLLHIADVMDGIYDVTEYNPFSRYMDQAVADAANEIMEQFFDLPQTKATFADRQARKLDEAKAKGRQRVQRVREQSNARLEELRKRNRQKVRDTIAKERSRRDTQIEKLKSRYRDKDAAGRERRNARELRTKITRHASALSQKLLRPSDKQHIPEKLRQATAAMLEAINLESAYSVDPVTGKRTKGTGGNPTKRTEAFRNLRLAYADITKEGGDYTLIIDPDLMDNLNELESMKDTPIAEMGVDQLSTVWAIVKAVEASIRTANKMLGESRFATISQLADGIKSDNARKNGRGDFKSVFGWIDKKTNFDMLTPQGFFHRLGNTGEELFRMMRTAQDRHIQIMHQAQEATRKALGKTNVTKLEGETHTFNLSSGKLTMSTAQIMSLYELMKRKQAQDHILKGGIRPEAANKRFALREFRRAEPVRVTLEDIAAITGVLTSEQRKMADSLQKYMGSTLAELGNEASMEVYGYRKFTEQNYFPIQVDKNQTKSDIAKEAQAQTIAGRGFTKGVAPHANNAVMLNSIFDVYASHVNDMATYAAWLPTMENIRRVRDFTFRDAEGNRVGDVKSVIERVFGKNGNPYLNKLVDDINQGIKPSGSGGTDVLIGNYKAAAVAANLRVVLQQPTAILRALDCLDAKYLLAGTVKRGDWEKVMKYAPIARWKDWGYFDINTGRQMKDVLFDSDSPLEKLKQATMSPAGKADSFAWARLWNAVEAETKDTRPGLKPGSDAFYQAVAARFSEIIDRTQVVDGLLQRSQIMRYPDTMDKVASSFMGEPTKTYNMFVNAVYDLWHSGDKKQAKRRLARVSAALVVSFAVNAVMQSIVDALRDDDKERDYWEKMLTAYTGFTGDEESFLDYWNSFWDGNLQSNINPLAYVPYIKDVLSVTQGYDVTRMDMDSVRGFWEAAVNMAKAMSGEGKYSPRGALINLASETARFRGIPLANIKRDVMAILSTFAIETDSYLMQYRVDKLLLNVGYTSNTGRFIDILYNASVNDREAYEIIYADMVKSGVDEAKIRRGMETRMKNAQGVKSVEDLTERYLAPSQEKDYTRYHSDVSRTRIWGNASADQREATEADLYDLIVGNSDGEKLRDKIDGGAACGIDETDYLLYRLALRMADQPTESGNYGSYTGEEVQTAIDMLPGLDDRARSYLWDAAGKSEKSNPYK